LEEAFGLEDGCGRIKLFLSSNDVSLSLIGLFPVSGKDETLEIDKDKNELLYPKKWDVDGGEAVGIGRRSTLCIGLGGHHERHFLSIDNRKNKRMRCLM